MKKFYIILLLLSIAGLTRAQVVITSKGTRVTIDSSKWVIAGNNIYNKNSGNVGIGTSNPLAQLHTTGTVRFAGIGTNTTNTNILTTDANGEVTTRTFASLFAGNAITSMNGLTGSVQTFTTGTSGTSFNISSTGTTHTFNLPTASSTNSGALSSANWTTFNNKIGTVTATTTAAVTTSTTTVTINNTAAYWNANQLQGKAVSSTAPTSGQLLIWNGTSWTPTTNTVSNTSSSNTLSTTVNGVTGSSVNIINSNTFTQNGTNQLVSTVNGIASTALTVNTGGDVTGNLNATVVSKINGTTLGTLTGASNGQVLTWNGSAWAPANATTTISGVSNTSSSNALTTTVNGVTGQSVNIINSNTFTQNGNNQLVSTVNGIASTALTVNTGGDVTGNLNATVVSKINGAPLGTTTGATNGQVLTWNGGSWTAANASATISGVSNTSSANTLSTTVNGVTGSTVNIINSNALSLSNGALTNTVNGVTSSSVNVLATASNGVNATSGDVQLGGSLTEATTITTSSTNTLALSGIQTGSSSDSLLVLATGGVIKKIASPVSFPQLLVEARRTSSYTTTASYATVVYNTAAINDGADYSTSTGIFTVPETGLYEIKFANEYGWTTGTSSTNQIIVRIMVNSTIDVEVVASGYRASTTHYASASGSTFVSLTAGDTVKIQAGGLLGTATAQVGNGQHVLKIIRHK